MGAYQYILIFSACIFQFTNGSLQFILPITAKNAQLEWFLTQKEASILVSSYQFGILLGGFFIGYLADNYGRYKVILVTCLVSLVSCVMLFFANKFVHLLVINILIGLFSCSNMVVLISYLFEHLPSKSRGKITVIFKSFTTIGRSGGILITSLLANPFQSEHWKSPTLLSGIMITVAFLPFFFVCRESLQYSNSSHNYPVLYQNFKWLQTINHKFSKQEVSEEEKITLDDIDILKANSLLRKSGLKKENRLEIYLSKKFLYLNFALTVNRMFLQSCFIGLGIILPLIFGSDQAGLRTISLIIAGEYFGIILCAFTVDQPSFGRKNTILICNLLTTILFFLCTYEIKMILPFLLFMTRGFIKCSLTATEIYAIEVYPVSIRALAGGVNTVMIGFGVSVFPLIFSAIEGFGSNFIYILMTGFLVITTTLSLFLPKDKER